MGHQLANTMRRSTALDIETQYTCRAGDQCGGPLSDRDALGPKASGRTRIRSPRRGYGFKPVTSTTEPPSSLALIRVRDSRSAVKR